jgi:hypothetical protein
VWGWEEGEEGSDGADQNGDLKEKPRLVCQCGATNLGNPEWMMIPSRSKKTFTPPIGEPPSAEVTIPLKLKEVVDVSGPKSNRSSSHPENQVSEANTNPLMKGRLNTDLG